MNNRVKHALGNVQCMVARSRFGLACTVKFQNQCSAIIGAAHGAYFSHHEQNGEEALVEQLRGRVRYFVDVGANRGTWTSMMLKSSETASGLLFEPGASALNVLRNSFSASPRIEIVPCAVSDSPGEAAFFEEENAGETSSLNISGAHAAGNSSVVRITTIDAEIQERQWPVIDFLKIDAEGYDFHVLRGARELLKSGRIAAGQFEYGAGWRDSGSTITHALKFLEDLNYRVFLLKKDGLYRPDVRRFGEYFGYSNYVFVHASSARLFDGMILRSL